MFFEKFVGTLQVQQCFLVIKVPGGSVRFQPALFRCQEPLISCDRAPCLSGAQPRETPSDGSHQAGFFTCYRGGHKSLLRHRTTSAGTWSWQRRYRLPRQEQSVLKGKYLQSSSWQVVLAGRKPEQAGCASLPSTFRPWSEPVAIATAPAAAKSGRRLRLPSCEF